MQVIRTVREIADTLKEGTVGFVPTMGALHLGHLSLVEQCRVDCDVVVVSIFVNPTQFNDPSDLLNYPRTEQSDLEMLRTAGVDIVFAPTVSEVYPTPDSRVFDFGVTAKVMEGASRPGHFNGVAQVVSRLFDIVKPHKAYFGQKDYQQLAIIRQMTSMLGYDIQIIGCDIIREPDGLAMSSRNTLLRPDERRDAPAIFATLRQAASMSGPDHEIEQWAAAQINVHAHLTTEYITIANPLTLQSTSHEGERHLFAAVRCGKVRLIDNLAMPPRQF